MDGSLHCAPPDRRRARTGCALLAAVTISLHAVVPLGAHAGDDFPGFRSVTVVTIPSGVMIHWELSEPDPAWVVTVERSTSPEGPWREVEGYLLGVDPLFPPLLQRPGTIVDRILVSGQPYYYRFVTGEASNRTVRHDPVAASWQAGFA